MLIDTVIQRNGVSSSLLRFSLHPISYKSLLLQQKMFISREGGHLLSLFKKKTGPSKHRVMRIAARNYQRHALHLACASSP